MSYITDKLLPMWPDGWMKFNDIQSHFMKPKEPRKDSKKSTSDTKTSKSVHGVSGALSPLNLPFVDGKDSVIMVPSAENKKPHIQKDPIKIIKNANDKPTLPKTEKKHSQHPIISSLPTIGETFNTKPVWIYRFFFLFLALNIFYCWSTISNEFIFIF